MRRVAQQRNSAVGNFLGLRLPRHGGKIVVQSCHVHQPVLLQAEARLCRQNPPHRRVQPLLRNLAGLHSLEQRVIRRIWYRRHQQGVHSGQKGAHRGIARRIAHGDSAHVHRVGDHEPLKAELLAEQIGQYARRKRRRRVRVRFQRRNIQVPGHDAAHARGNRRAEGHKFELLKARAIRRDYGQIDV